MNFQIAAQGRSFKGAMAHYTHDKRDSSDRPAIISPYISGSSALLQNLALKQGFPLPR